MAKVQEEQNEELKVKAVQQAVQGAWTKWSDFVNPARVYT